MSVNDGSQTNTSAEQNVERTCQTISQFNNGTRTGELFVLVPFITLIHAFLTCNINLNISYRFACIMSQTKENLTTYNTNTHNEGKWFIKIHEQVYTNTVLYSQSSYENR